jgi:RecB family exonuclease
MSLLAQEFNRPVTRAAFSRSAPREGQQAQPGIAVDEALRSTLRNFTYSYSSLAKIMACPYLFYLQYIAGLKPPSFMDDEENINMLMGDFVHKFLARFSAVIKSGDSNWEELFGKMWVDEQNASLRDKEGINIYMLNAKIFLGGIYEDEKASGRQVIFGDNALACEKEFTGMLAGRYRIKGVCDRLAEIDGKTQVIDFKYSKISDRYNISQKKSVTDRFAQSGLLHPVAQLMIYRHFLPEATGARFYFLKETGRVREKELPDEEITRTGQLLELIGGRLDEIIAADEIRSVKDSGECRYCRFQAFCGRDGFYKAARRYS